MDNIQKKLLLLSQVDNSLIDTITGFDLSQTLRYFPLSQYTKLAQFVEDVPRHTTNKLIQMFIAQFYEGMRQFADAMPEDYLALLNANVRFRKTNHEIMAFSLGEMWRRKELLSPQHHVKTLELLSEAGIFIEEILTYTLQSILKSPAEYQFAAPELAYYVGRLKPMHGVLQVSQVLRPVAFESREKVAMWAAGNLMTRGNIDLIELKRVYDSLPASKNTSISELIFLQIVDPNGTINSPKPTLESLFSISASDQKLIKDLLSDLSYKEIAGVGTSIGPYYFDHCRKFLWPTTPFVRGFMSDTLRGDFQFYKESLLKAGFDVIEKPVPSLLQLSKAQLQSLLSP